MSRLIRYAAATGVVAAMWAASTTVWELNTYEDFARGKFEQVSVDSSGQLALAPKLELVFASEQPAIWSLAEAPDGRLYVGTGHRGYVYEVAPDGAHRVLWAADEPEVFAITIGPDGALYAATSPNGKVYRVQSGQAEVYFDPKATYIWSLHFGPDGALYVGTGDPAHVYRVTARNQGELYYDTGQSHVVSLAFDPQGKLLAGTEPNGILYRITGKDQAFVLQDAEHPEIRTVVPLPDGSLYVAALGGWMDKRVSAAQAAPPRPQQVIAAPTSITVTATQGGLEIKPPKGQTAQVTAQTAQPVLTPPQTTEVPGAEKSAVYRIYADHTVEKIWASKEANAFDLLVLGDTILVSTDKEGTIYQLDGERKVRLVTKTGESEAVRLLRTQRGIYVATSNMGKIFRLTSGYSERGTYESPVHDAGSVARWGRLQWTMRGCPGCEVWFQTRSGNTPRPDATWSDWSKPLTNPEGGQIESPNARYIQWRAVLKGPGADTPFIQSVRLAYLPQNSPPRLTNLTIRTQATSTSAKALSTTSSDTSTFTVTVTASGDTKTTSSSGTPTQSLERALAEQIELSWQADDPDNDELEYSLYFRGEGEQHWKLLRANLKEKKWTLDSDALADGRYYFRVVASDAPSNAPDRARQSELVSPPILIDHTPPQVSLKLLRRSDEEAELVVEAKDATSPIARAMYALDAGSWILLDPDDGVADSLAERFLIRLSGLREPEHLIVVRVLDSAGNAGLARLVLRR